MFRTLVGLNIDDEMKMMRSLLQTTIQEFSSNELVDDGTPKKKNAWSGKGLSIKAVGDGSLTANIIRIDEFGLVTVRFNRQVLKIENTT